MIANIWILLIPLWILLALLVTLGVFALLGRIAGGKYLRPVVTTIMKLPLLGRGMKKGSEAALERQNPDLASAIKKLERYGARTSGDEQSHSRRAPRVPECRRRASRVPAPEPADAPADGPGAQARPTLVRVRNREATRSEARRPLRRRAPLPVP